ncbi:DUF3558 family protein [Amycolatopsis sp. NPDC059657]|uniref:DUF3558 family protein n=1 Tax=Amycolatopsis sp. NPDC059657 TaxID=3346899 RepID=UPI003670F52F
MALLSIAGCSAKEPGTAQPSTGAPGTSASSPSGPSSSGNNGSPTAALDPCSLLDPVALGEFGPFDGGPRADVKPGARVCNLGRKLMSATDEVLVIGVAVRDEQGLADTNETGAGKTEGKVNGRKALQVPDLIQHCLIVLEVTATSRVDVAITASDPQQACKVAGKVADLVEPKLPKG